MAKSKVCPLASIAKYSSDNDDDGDDKTTLTSDSTSADSALTSEDELDSESGTDGRDHDDDDIVVGTKRPLRGAVVRARKRGKLGSRRQIAEPKAPVRKKKKKQPLTHCVNTPAPSTPLENTGKKAKDSERDCQHRKAPEGFRAHTDPGQPDRVICLECGNEYCVQESKRHFLAHRYKDVLICESCGHRCKCRGGRTDRFNRHRSAANHFERDKRFIRIRTVIEAKD